MLMLDKIPEVKDKHLVRAGHVLSKIGGEAHYLEDLFESSGLLTGLLERASKHVGKNYAERKWARETFLHGFGALYFAVEERGRVHWAKYELPLLEGETIQTAKAMVDMLSDLRAPQKIQLKNQKLAKFYEIRGKSCARHFQRPSFEKEIVYWGTLAYAALDLQTTLNMREFRYDVLDQFRKA
jgi:hypothetical protein